LKLLIVYGSKGKFFHLKEFGEALTKFGVSYKLVRDIDYIRGFPSKNLRDWFPNKKKFKKLLEEFLPDAVFIDRQSHFGLAIVKEKIPLFILLRGHYWSEYEWAKKTLYKGPIVRMILWFRNRVIEKCFKEATAILPICSYLQNVVKEHHPDQSTSIFFEGVESSRWYPVKGTQLKHPCVGLLQDANWWGKTKEMLILTKVLEALPNVNFYWAGDGPYKDQVLSKQKKYPTPLHLNLLKLFVIHHTMVG